MQDESVRTLAPISAAPISVLPAAGRALAARRRPSPRPRVTPPPQPDSGSSGWAPTHTTCNDRFDSEGCTLAAGASV